MTTSARLTFQRHDTDPIFIAGFDAVQERQQVGRFANETVPVHGMNGLDEFGFFRIGRHDHRNMLQGRGRPDDFQGLEA